MPRPPDGEPGPLPRADGFGRLLASSWRLHRATLGRLFWPYAALAVTVSPFPSGALAVVAHSVLATGGPATGIDVVLFVGTLTLPIALVGSFASCVAAVVMVGSVCGRDVRVSDAAATVWRARRDVAPAALVVAIMAWGLVMLGGFQGFGFAPVLVFVVLGPPVLAHVVVVEGVAFEPAVARGRALMRGNAVRTGVYLVAVGILVFVVLLAAVEVAVTLSGAVASIAYFPALAIAGGATLPFAAAAALTLYVEARASNEDLDAASLCAPRPEH